MKTQATSLDAVRPMSFNSVEQRMSPISSLGESLSRAGARFGCFGRATLGPDVGIERTEELLGGLRDPFNGNKENCFVGFARLVEAGDFPDELQGSSANLVTRHGRFKVEKSLDISTHDYHLLYSQDNHTSAPMQPWGNFDQLVPCSIGDHADD